MKKSNVKNKGSGLIGLLTIMALFIVMPVHAAENNDKQLAADILVFVNQYRVQHGLPKLVMNRELTHEASQHSVDMASHALPFGHDGFSNRISRLHHQIPEATSGAENVAYNYKTARIVVDGWIKSPGHRQNIMGHYTLTGIGIARDKMGKLYYTQLFLRLNNSSTVARNVVTHRTV